MIGCWFFWVFVWMCYLFGIRLGKGNKLNIFIEFWVYKVSSVDYIGYRVWILLVGLVVEYWS